MSLLRGQWAVLMGLFAVLGGTTTNTRTMAQSTTAEVAATYPPLFTDPTLEPVYSRLWGQNGERWDAEAAEADPASVRLRDYTSVGYAMGDAPIPSRTWPIWKTLPELGGIPNDGLSDVDALRRAVQECPPNHVIYLPSGRYIIDEQIVFTAEYSNITIRGESRDSTVLFFPKHAREIHQTPTDAALNPMILFLGGRHRGLEDLSIAFRDEQKGTGYWRGHTTADKQVDAHWFYVGEMAIAFRQQASDSWLQNIYLKNTNHPIDVQERSTRLSFIDIVIDQFWGRTSEQDRQDGHMGIKVGDFSSHILVHNVLFTGDFVHDIAAMGTQHSVFSRMVSWQAMKLDHHAQGNVFNLYTEANLGKGGQHWGEDINNFQETYWGLQGQGYDKYLPSSRQCTFVGIHTDDPTSIGNTWHHETLNPLALSPANMYLAQMVLKPDKYLPPYRDLLPLPPPPVPYRKVFQILPTDDVDTGRASVANVVVKGGLRDGFVKFDFGQTPGLAAATSVASARLRFFAERLFYDWFELRIHQVTDDDWTEDSITRTDHPDEGALMYNMTFYRDQFPMWFDFDLTDWVNENLSNGDKQVSITLMGRSRAETQLAIRSKEDGANPIHLNVVLDPELVDPPAAPTGVVAKTGQYWIHLDWNDNIEPDMAFYNVYKHREGSDGNPIREAMGLVASAYTDFAVEVGKEYTYTITAVDFANMESVHSEIIIATPCKDCDPTKQPPLKRVYPLGFFSETGESLYEEIDKGDGTIDTGDDDDNSQLEPIVCITTYRDSTLCSSDKRCVWSAGFCWDSSTGTYTSAATPSKAAVGLILPVVLFVLNSLLIVI